MSAPRPRRKPCPAFMNSAECLMDLDQQPAVKRCHDETLKDIEDANSRPNLRMDVKLGLMCGSVLQINP